MFLRLINRYGSPWEGIPGLDAKVFPGPASNGGRLGHLQDGKLSDRPL